MKNRKAFLITGGSFVNKGAEAMALTMKEKLSTAFPNSKIFMRVDPLYFDIARQNGLIPVDASSNLSLLKKIRRKLITLGHYLLNDALIDIGGYQFGEPWGWRHANNAVKKIRYCNKFKTKTIFMPQAMGPFINDAFKKYIPLIINESSLFLIRDKKSHEEVNKISSISNMCLQPDIAWRFNAKDVSIDDIMIKYNLAQFKLKVCITPNLRVYEKEGERYLLLLLKIIDVFSAKGYQAILLGHELRLEQQIDDRYLCRILKSRNPSSIHIDEFLSSKQVKQIIGKCDIVVSSRFHALIAAFSQMIPALAIGWSHKYEELLKDVGLPNNLIKITDDNEQNDIENVINIFIDNYRNQKSVLIENIPGILAKTNNMLDNVVRILN